MTEQRSISEARMTVLDAWILGCPAQSGVEMAQLVGTLISLFAYMQERGFDAQSQQSGKG